MTTKKSTAKKGSVVPPEPNAEAWRTPVDIDRVTQVFPARIMHLLPPYEVIPPEFKNWNNQTKWNRFISGIFFGGIDRKSIKLIPKPDIDPQKAWTVISTILGSFDPKHEHKEAGTAYLMSLWFEESSTWEAQRIGS